MAKQSVSFRMDEEDLKTLDNVAERYGLRSRTAAIMFAANAVLLPEPNLVVEIPIKPNVTMEVPVKTGQKRVVSKPAPKNTPKEPAEDFNSFANKLSKSHQARKGSK